jgi:hypothetical protein
MKISFRWLGAALVLGWLAILGIVVSATDHNLDTLTPQKEDGPGQVAMRQAAAVAKTWDTMTGQTYILLSASTQTTNSAALNVSTNLYHTVHTASVATNITNGAIIIVQRSLDGTNWLASTAAAVTTTNVAEISMVGKWTYLRVVVSNYTDGAFTARYIGGR